MIDSKAADDRLPMAVPAAARLYLLPRGLDNRLRLQGLIPDGAALPLAGGPLAFTACEVAVRVPGHVHRAVAPVAELRLWAARLGGAPAERVTGLLERLSRPRPQGLSGRRLMGIVNVTPDSFSDGGAHLDPAAAIAHARHLAADGADILDIGGESTRPGAAPVEPAAEAARVRPVLQGLAAVRAEFPRLLLSIDTRHALVMRAALAAGIDIINDVTALTGDPDSLAVAAGSEAAVVLMHMQGEPATMNLAPSYGDVALDVFDYLELRVRDCVAAGIAEERLIVDPGIGFGKRGEHNLAILRALALYHGLGCPLLVGVSRKGLGSEAEARWEPKDRLPLSLAAALHALNQGVQLLRVHEVAETRRVVELWERLNSACSRADGPHVQRAASPLPAGAGVQSAEETK